MSDFVEIENRAGISRVTCGWKLAHLDLDFVRPYWRDAHSPAIARRDGLYEYRHYPLDPIRADLFAPLEGVDLAGKADEQLMWLSDVRYRDAAGMDAFGADPGPAEKAKILGDIEMIVDKSTTYKVIGDNARTLLDATSDPAPAGPAAHPTFEVFFRQRGDEAPFRAAVRALADRWAKAKGVKRVRLNLFEVPDMEAERKAGYPVKTHPAEMQYQAWIDLVLDDAAAARTLLQGDAGLAGEVVAVHAYPAPAVYTFNWNGRPTLAGLRGYPAVAAIRSLGAEHQKDPGLLQWMYGDIAAGGGLGVSATVSERLVAFARAQQTAGVPRHATHEANRLIVNQLKASVCALDEEAVAILRTFAQRAGGPGPAHVLWFGDALAPEHACMVNAALFEVLDFNETYIPTFQHAVSGVLPAVLATAEATGSSGAQVLDALALGIEVELACAAILMPTAYFRGFVPGGITGAIGGALACGLLRGLDDVQLRNALGLAMNSGLGFYHSAGSQALPYVMGLTARNGLTACELAAAGLNATAAAFEGDKGMLKSYSDETPERIEQVLSTLGDSWRIMGQSYKTVPTETITHGPIECVLALLKRSNGRTPATMRFGVEAIVVKIADERGERFGAPSSNLEAKFDLRHCAAAAWVRGRFTLAEMERPAFTDPAILDLRSRIELVADPEHKTFEGASCEVAYTDGTRDRVVIPAFRGTPTNPMSDAELSDVFRQSAESTLTPAGAEAVLAAAWGLPTAPNIGALMAACVARS